MDRKIIWSNKKLLKGTKFLITESLTKRRMKLYAAARNTMGPRNAWTADGRIFVRSPNNEIKRINDFNDLPKGSVVSAKTGHNRYERRTRRQVNKP